MKKIRVTSSKGNYEILVGRGLLARAGSLIAPFKPGKVLVVTQAKIARYHLPKVLKSLASKKIKTQVFYLPDGEVAKSGKELFRLYAALLKGGFERRDMIFALGGGVVGDLSGFAAATYLRGIGFVNAGTTLLAQVDSSIGGKTGINLPEGKNLAGAFYPPKLVISDVETLKTLPKREFIASLAEVVKYGVIRDAAFFRFLEKRAGAILKRGGRELEKIVTVSSQTKAGVVSRDEFETKGERMILNFGHTFGHGFEKAMNYRGWLHGEAVSAGMTLASELSYRLGLWDCAAHCRLDILLGRFGLPVSLAGKNIKADVVLKAMMHDKKKKAGRLRFVLPRKIGKVEIYEGIPEELLREILKDKGATS